MNLYGFKLSMFTTLLPTKDGLILSLSFLPPSLFVSLLSLPRVYGPRRTELKGNKDLRQDPSHILPLLPPGALQKLLATLGSIYKT